MTDIQQVIVSVVQGLASSTVFILALMIGFCVVVGFTKLEEDIRQASWSSRAWTNR